MAPRDRPLSAPPVEAWREAAAVGSARVHRSRRVAVLVLGDLLALLAVLPGAVWAAGRFRGQPGPSLLDRPWAFAVVVAAIPFLAMLGLYGHRWRINQALTLEYPRVLLGLSLFGFIALQVFHGTDIDVEVLLDGEIFALWLFGWVAVTIERGAVRSVVLPRLVGSQRTIIVGAGLVGQKIARSLTTNPHLNIEVVGFVDTDPQPLAEDLDHIAILGPEEHLVAIVKATRAHRVIISFSRATPEGIIEIMRWSDLHRIHITIVPRFFEVITSHVELDTVGGMTVLDLAPAQLPRAALAVKRATDLALPLLALPLLVPLFAAIAVAIKIDSRGPVFFRQSRSGQGSEVFKIFKFRTMVVDAEALRGELLHRNEVTGPLFKLKEDPRVTRLGRFLRRTSLDELPQLINVVRGDMSLVGPRPFVIDEDQGITGWARRRLDLTPGVTGLWQVMGRNDMPFDEMVKLDYMYVTRWSLALDLKILLRTVPTVLRRQGAY